MADDDKSNVIPFSVNGVTFTNLGRPPDMTKESLSVLMALAQQPAMPVIGFLNRAKITFAENLAQTFNVQDVCEYFRWEHLRT